ncbi:MAG: hypothetical protein KTR31_17165 [Myxococcales bacterium]|nr:hypothetical protein [Myxococcales bacterium]
MSGLVCFLAARASFAQDTFDAHGFKVGPQDGDLRSAFVVPRPTARTAGDWFASGLLQFADAPMVAIATPAQGEPTRTTMLDDVLALYASAGVVVHRRVQLSAAAPLYLLSRGPDGTANGVSAGDVRLLGHVTLLEPDRGLGLGLAPHVDLPTGRSEVFLGESSVAGGARLTATWEGRRWTASAAAGAQLDGSVDLENIRKDDTLLASAGFGVLLGESHAAHVELDYRRALGGGADRRGSGGPLEALLSVKGRRDSGAHWFAGASTALSPGVTAARFRAVVGGGFGRRGSTDPCSEGCPGDLGELPVTVLWQGQPMSGASVMAQSVDAMHQATADGSFHRFGGLPLGSEWTVTARKGVCLEGVATTVVRPEPAAVQIELAPQLAARVRVELIDQLGQPVPQATWTWGARPDGCVPEPRTHQVAHRDEYPVAVGRSSFTVEAVGYRPVSQSLVAEADELSVIKVVLTEQPIELHDH